MLFLCAGNVCRSPFAAALFARATTDWPFGPPTVRSAGLIAANRIPPAEAILVADRAGVDLRSHRSSLLTADAIESANLVVVMTPEQARRIRRRFRSSGAYVLVLGDLDPQTASTRAIADPWGYPVSAFEESYARIARCVAELARLLSPLTTQPARAQGLTSEG